MQGLSPEIVRAAHVVLQDLRCFGIELGGAFERALASAVVGGEVSPAPAVVAAIEAGRQAVAHAGPHPSENGRVHAARVDIQTLTASPRRAGSSSLTNTIDSPAWSSANWNGERHSNQLARYTFASADGGPGPAVAVRQAAKPPRRAASRATSPSLHGEAQAARPLKQGQMGF